MDLKFIGDLPELHHESPERHGLEPFPAAVVPSILRPVPRRPRTQRRHSPEKASSTSSINSLDKASDEPERLVPLVPRHHPQEEDASALDPPINGETALVPFVPQVLAPTPLAWFNPVSSTSPAQPAGHRRHSRFPPQEPRAAATYPCLECGRLFGSYQALGGHMTKHRKDVAAAPNSAPAGNNIDGEKKIHSCKICSKSFPSGMALGGHMRLHYEGKQTAAAAVAAARTTATLTAGSYNSAGASVGRKRSRREMSRSPDLNAAVERTEGEGGEEVGSSSEEPSKPLVYYHFRILTDKCRSVEGGEREEGGEEVLESTLLEPLMKKPMVYHQFSILTDQLR